jgi:hypothetical protein
MINKSEQLIDPSDIVFPWKGIYSSKDGAEENVDRRSFESVLLRVIEQKATAGNAATGYIAPGLVDVDDIFSNAFAFLSEDLNIREGADFENWVSWDNLDALGYSRSDVYTLYLDIQARVAPFQDVEGSPENLQALLDVLTASPVFALDNQRRNTGITTRLAAMTMNGDGSRAIFRDLTIEELQTFVSDDREYIFTPVIELEEEQDPDPFTMPFDFDAQGNMRCWNDGNPNSYDCVLVVRTR